MVRTASRALSYARQTATEEAAISEQSLPTATIPTAVPGQRLPGEHPMRPDTLPPPDPATRRSPDPTPEEPYAHWWRRVVATLIDVALVIPFWVVAFIGTSMFVDGTTFITDGTSGPGSVQHVVVTTDTWVGGALTVVAYLSLLVFSMWNRLVRQGRRGASIGKACLHLVVVDAVDGRPIGVFGTFVRNLAHVIDAILLDLGFLWPLVDRRRQTFADKIVNTVVLHLPPLPRAPVPTYGPSPYR